MQKIISLFQRNYDGDHLARDEIVPGAEWVVAGEGVATRKYDGTCCMVRGGKLFRRYDCKRGKTPPPGFEAAMEPDPVTGHHCGWLPVDVNNVADHWHVVAFYVQHDGHLSEGTYELCGPKIQGNPENFPYYTLIVHGLRKLPAAPRTFDGLKAYFLHRDIEGIVWHHPGGRMVKIKGKDFGIKRSGAS